MIRKYSEYASSTVSNKQKTCIHPTTISQRETPFTRKLNSIYRRCFIPTDITCVSSYLSGNFAPIKRTLPLTPCTYTGTIPKELLGGQYIRNGGNPVTNEDLGRHAHWFDGDGMIAGVLFSKSKSEHDDDADNGEEEVQPQYVNQYILTDLFLSALGTPSLKSPILPSIATLLNPASTLFHIIYRVMRTVFLVILSRLPGSTFVIKKISVANTALVYHDGRALATCESGPPMRVALPTLDTIGWYNGREAVGEGVGRSEGPVLGGEGFLHFMREWTTGHPKVDPDTKEMILYQCTFMKPYVHYSVIPEADSAASTSSRGLMNAAVPGLSSPKMMHDFGVSQKHTIIMDLPLALDPTNLMRGLPVVGFDPTKKARFGVFPRHEPAKARWFETSACCIFHTVNSWDTPRMEAQEAAVHMLACRLTSASLVFGVGNIAEPEAFKNAVAPANDRLKPKWWKSSHVERRRRPKETSRSPSYEKGPVLESPYTDDPSISSQGSSYVDTETSNDTERNQCRLYYYCFSLLPGTENNKISHQWALSALPFEFASLHPDLEMKAARYVYGCSTTTGSFTAALGRAVKIDMLVKFDTQTLINRGVENPPLAVSGCVDSRTIADFKSMTNPDPTDPIQVFFMPDGWFAQEPRFVPRKKTTSEEPGRELEEDDGYLLFYAFNENGQMDERGECLPDAVSELWVMDAKNLRDVVARVKLPQRVPYGLHGKWFSEDDLLAQRPYQECRAVPTQLRQDVETEVSGNGGDGGGLVRRNWLRARSKIIASLG